MTEFCPVCDCEECTLMGMLGSITWLRCRACGMTFPADADPVRSAETYDGVACQPSAIPPVKGRKKPSATQTYKRRPRATSGPGILG